MCTSSAPMNLAMAGKEVLRTSAYKVLVDRCRRLEASQVELRQQFDELLLEKENEEAAAEDSCYGYIPGFFSDGGPYRSILESMGHAVHVCSVSTGEITYWNQSAENIYGWKYDEIIGQRMDQLLAAGEYITALQNIMEKLSFGQSWSGQFPFKKRSGEVFMGMATKSPMYEDGKLVGVVTVSSDAAHLNSRHQEHPEDIQLRVNWLPKEPGQKSKKIQWAPRPQIVPVPQIASSVSQLASKVLLRRSEDDSHNECPAASHEAAQSQDALLKKPAKLAEKLLEKLHIGGSKSVVQEGHKSYQQNGSIDRPESEKASSEPDMKTPPSGTRTSTARTSTASESEEIAIERTSISAARDCYGAMVCERTSSEANQLNLKAADIRDNLLTEQNDRDGPGTGGSTGSRGSSSSQSDSASSSMVNYEIQWEDLQMGEEIGQGSFAVVHRGIWKGSDVAIKVYFGNDFDETTLQDYKKEINIMKRLRHPNVLLFMGAVYSQERLAIVTEFLPRGSLFKTLHKSKQAIDIRRRMRMALDIARGMNYLHHRNPPIIHRDLKSSNLLVDRNWNVKVGDFGLSRLKNATLITTKSGRGTPQWMAPEVLRNEPSNEKSDVFSFGVVLWELMTQSVPWNNLNSLQVVGVVSFMDRRLDIPEGINPDIASIIRDCWHSDPNQRPGFEDILQRMTSFLCRAAAASAQTAKPTANIE